MIDTPGLFVPLRQTVDEEVAVVTSYEFDPYGNPVNNIGGDPYGYTGIR